MTNTVLWAGGLVVLTAAGVWWLADMREARDAANAQTQPVTSGAGLSGSSNQGAQLGQSIVTGLTALGLAGANLYQHEADASRQQQSSHEVNSGSSTPH